MDSKEKHTNENERVDADMLANSLRAEGRDRRRENTKKVNRLWLWLGILVLVAILLYWLFSIGLFESMAN
jgi:cytochrome c-type biogenesis protein CcmH/NrfG